MTGCFTLKIDGKVVKSVELPTEIFEDIEKWFYSCKTDSKLEIVCELEM